MFGFDAVHAHIGRELWALDNNRLFFVEPQQAEKLLGRLDVSYHDRHVVEVFDHGFCSCRRLGLRLSSLKQTVTAHREPVATVSPWTSYWMMTTRGSRDRCTTSSSAPWRTMFSP